MKNKSKFLFMIIGLIIFSISLAYSQDENGADPRLINNLSGFDGLEWGADFESVRESVKGRLVFVDDNVRIISRDGEITYFYGFFYRDPEKVKIEEDEEENIPKLFYTVLEFPYISAARIRAIYTERYGEPTRENIRNNRGAYIWESEDTVLILWVDEYERNSFVRRINFISTEVSKNLSDYSFELFNQEEISVIEGLLE